MTSSSIGEELWKLKDKVDQYWEAEFLRRANFFSNEIMRDNINNLAIQ